MARSLTVSGAAVAVMLIRSAGSPSLSLLMVMRKVPVAEDAAAGMFMEVSWVVIW